MGMRILGVLFLLLSVSGPARAAERAQDRRADRREDRGEDRREVTARELFGAGRYGEALDIYIKLYAERPHPTYLRNIGRCYQNLGDADHAISSFRDYLRQAENLAPNQRALVEGYIAEMEGLKRKHEEQQVKPEPEPRPPRLTPVRPKESPAEPDAVTREPVTVTKRPPRAHPDDREPPAARGPARYVIGAGGLAALGTGAYFGLRAISKRKDSDRECVGGCTQAGVSLNNQAKTAARVSDIAIGVGLIGAGIAAYLFLTSPESEPTRASAGDLRIAPEIGPHQAALQLGGAW